MNEIRATNVKSFCTVRRVPVAVKPITGTVYLVAKSRYNRTLPWVKACDQDKATLGAEAEEHNILQVLC